MSNGRFWLSVLAGTKFFSSQADGSFDAGNIELFLVLYFDVKGWEGACAR